MQSNTAIIITNFNMPERTDALCESVNRRVHCNYRLIVVDNGSDLKEPSRFTEVYLPKNVQTTGGFLAGLDHADKIGHFDYYWFIITSSEFDDWWYDPLLPMVDFLDNHPDAVGIHPALTSDSTTHWEHMKTRGGEEPRPTWFIDNIAALYRADWFNSIGRFDPNLIYAWGIDLETCYLARKQKRSLWIDERTKIKKVTNIGYTMGRMGMEADTRAKLATENMTRVLTKKYGEGFYKKLTEDFIDDSLR